jgi:LysM repeat protein
MNSVKNLFVVVMLMGVSYGAYHVISTPEPVDYEDEKIEELDIQIGEGFDDYSLSPAETEPAPGLPELPQIAEHRPPLHPPQLKDTEPALPALPEPGQLHVPAAFSSPATRQPPGNDDPNFLAPTPPSNLQEIAPPPSGGDRLSDGNSGLAADGPHAIAGGEFRATPETNMTEVTPPSQFIPPTPETGDFAGPVEETITNAQDAVNSVYQTTPDASLDDTRSVSGPADGATAMLNESTGDFNSGAGGLLAEGIQNPYVSSESPAPPAGNTAPATATTAARIDWQGISQLAANDRIREALEQLSLHYQAALPEDQRLQMLEWLDLLAGKVIYSTEHWLQAEPYVVQPNDTLESIASAWNVPPQLVYNINRSKIGDRSDLVPGTELKVVQGPFNAVVNLQRQELTLFLRDMYAGRFPIDLGQDGPGIEHGIFQVQQKLPGREYQSADGQTIAAAAAENP